MTKNEFTQKLQAETKSLDSYLTRDDYSNALDDGSRETGWAFPITDDFKIYWMKERAKRHVFFYLMTESAHKFKFKQINLQQRFEHYQVIIKDMDQKFVEIQEERPDMFASVDPFKMFGTKIDAGFSYVPQTGEDQTYTEDNEVIFTPTEND